MTAKKILFLSINTECLLQVSESSLHLVQRSELKDAELVEDLAQEFSDLRSDVAARLEALVDSLSPPEMPTTEDDEDSRELPPIAVNTSIQVRCEFF